MMQKPCSEQFKVGVEHPGVYTSADLDLFRIVVDAALARIAARSGAELTPSGEHLVRIWLAAAVFRNAHGGERDPSRLEQAAISAVSKALDAVNRMPHPARCDAGV
jgi:hypothetical protein